MESLFGYQFNLSNKLYNPLIFIVGPTAIGKSSLALKIAKKNGGEIINADSMQVYKDLNILTARPTKEDHKLITHHLYGYVESSFRYNVSKWCNDILEVIKKNNKKKISSIIVGGTGMYIDKLINGLVETPAISNEIKKKSENLILDVGVKNFYNLIQDFDKESLIKVSQNDTSRLRRIWEVYMETNKPLSLWVKEKNKMFLSDQKYYLNLFIPDRQEIYKKVNDRFKVMIKSGAIEEVKKLKEKELDESLPITRAHGVPEILKYLSGSINLEECIDMGQQVTRNYVKRQLTWWRSSKLEISNTFHEFPANIDLNSIKY
tara:strand:- start:2821 stop:3777 length:957 start_codon:yes stop_codon:yes gene_type:complete